MVHAVFLYDSATRTKDTCIGCTQTTSVPAEPGLPWRVSHLSIIQAQCCLTSVFGWELMYPTW
jgi:hypothetical protein